MASLISGLPGVTWKSGLQQDNMEFAWSLQLLWILAAQSYSPGERCARVCWLPSATEGDTEDCSATASNPEQMLDKRENLSSLHRNVPASLSKPGPQQLVTTWHSMGLEGLKFSKWRHSWLYSEYLRASRWIFLGKVRSDFRSCTYSRPKQVPQDGFSQFCVCYKSSCIAGTSHLLHLIIQLVLIAV